MTCETCITWENKSYLLCNASRVSGTAPLGTNFARNRIRELKKLLNGCHFCRSVWQTQLMSQSRRRRLLASNFILNNATKACHWHCSSKLHTKYITLVQWYSTWLSGAFKPENGFTSSSLNLFRPVILSDMIAESSHGPTGKPAGINSLPWLSANPSFSALFYVLLLFPISGLDDISPEEKFG